MPATVSIKELNGAAPGTSNTITNCRFCTTDSYNPGTGNKLKIPSSGSNYSYWKTLYLNADTSPAGDITNIKIYTDGSLGFGVNQAVYIGNEIPSTYVQSTGTEGETGDEIVASHTGITAKTDLFTYTSANKKSVSGSITNPNTGKISNYIIIQQEVPSTTVIGTNTAETITLSYDES